MRLSLKVFLPLIALAVAAPPAVLGQDAIPRFMSVEPMAGKTGADIVVTGENIGKEYVAEVYFTDGTNDIKVVLQDQTATTIKCKIPKGVKTGIRYRLMILTKGKEPKLIEQPVKVEIVDEIPPTQ